MIVSAPWQFNIEILVLAVLLAEASKTLILLPFCIGIVNWAEVAEHYGKIFEQNGGHIHLGYNVTSIDANSNSSLPLRIKSSNNKVNILF